uniref:Uncharacterized protein n=1 Tax=Rhizophora mucronata TaxID=61149 RepID=A0A2P2QFV8_RHIMU
MFLSYPAPITYLPLLNPSSPHPSPLGMCTPCTHVCPSLFFVA